MTINGPAAMLTGFFMNAAIDQQCELYIRKHGQEELVNEKSMRFIRKEEPFVPVTMENYQKEMMVWD
jgi:methylmalonyl-CoA mutase